MTETNHDGTLAALHDAIVSVAPDTDPQTLDPSEDLWYALDLDSMDQLNVMIAIGRRLQVEIPEADYPRLESLQQLVDYVQRARA